MPQFLLLFFLIFIVTTAHLSTSFASERSNDLLHAVNEGKLSQVEFLLNKHFSPNILDDAESKTPLHIACQKNYSLIAKRLLEKGADPTAKDIFQKTPLHYAAEHGHLGCSQLLLNDNSVAINALDNKGLSPLAYAVLQDHIALAELLIEQGANLDTIANVVEPSHISLAMRQLLEQKQPSLLPKVSPSKTSFPFFKKAASSVPTSLTVTEIKGMPWLNTPPSRTTQQAATSFKVAEAIKLSPKRAKAPSFKEEPFSLIKPVIAYQPSSAREEKDSLWLEIQRIPNERIADNIIHKVTLHPDWYGIRAQIVNSPFNRSLNEGIHVRFGPLTSHQDAKVLCALAEAKATNCAVIGMLGKASSTENSTLDAQEDTSSGIRQAPYWIQLGSFSSREKAEALQTTLSQEISPALRKKYHFTVTAPRMGSHKKALFRLKFGSFAHSSEAETVLSFFEERGFDAILVEN